MDNIKIYIDHIRGKYIRLIWLGDRELGNGPSWSIERREFVDGLRNYWLPKKDTTAWG